LDAFPYQEHVENIPDPESQPPPPPLLQTEIFPSAGAPLIEYIAKARECDPQGCLETNLQNNPYYQFAMLNQYNYMQCGIKKIGLNTYYDNVLKIENTALHFPSVKNEDGVKKLVACMQDDQALGEWELHTVENMRWNDNHQHPIKYCSRDIIKSMRWLMPEPAYTEHLIHAPQGCFNSDRPLKRLDTKMHTADWW
jgi:hypothetical protein